MRYLNYFFLLLLCTTIFLGGCGKSEESYKKASVQVNYEELSRKPDSFKGKPIAFASQISNVKDDDKSTELLFNAGKTPILAHYKYKGNEERFLANDFVRVWGDYKKISNKKIDELTETSVIEIDAQYISRPVWSFLVDFFGYNAWTTAKNGQVNSFDTDSIQLSLGYKKINPDSVDVEGTITFKGAYFMCKGIINDNGAGEFEYIDKDGNMNGIKGKIVIKNKNEIEIETPQIEQEKLNPFPHFGEPAKTTLVTIQEGKYILTRK